MKRQILVTLLLAFGILFAEWTIVETFVISENTSGLAWDGEYLYFGTFGADEDCVYRLDPADGSYSLLFNGSMGDTYDMTWDGANLWAIGHTGGISTPARACRLDMQGNILEQITLPVHYMSGIAWDDGDFWVAAYDDPDGFIYKIDGEGNILEGFNAPYYQPWSLCMEGEYLWMVDKWSNEIYKIDPADGSVVEHYFYQIDDPTGIVFDGEFFWYCANGPGNQDRLFKVDPNGDGTPEIELGWEEYHFGEVFIGTQQTTMLSISNNGTCDLSINEITISDDAFSISVDLPIVIESGSSHDLEITFDPLRVGEFTDTLEILSNDPNQLSAIVTMAAYVVDSQSHIVLQPEQLHYGSVRHGGLTGRYICIKNWGLENLVVNDITSDNELIYENELDFPVSIPARDSIFARIWFQTGQTGGFSAEVTIESNDPDDGIMHIPVDASVENVSPVIGTEYWHWSFPRSTREITALKKFIDINGDEIEEVIACDRYGILYCLNGNSAGEADIIWEFIGCMNHSFAFSDRGVVVADDLNGDGLQDVVIGSAGSNGSICALNSLDGEVIWQFDTIDIGGARIYQIDGRLDYTGDGICDIVAGIGYFYSATILLNGATGDVEWIREFSRDQDLVCAIDDQNGDGIPDVYCAESESYYNKLYLLSGASGWVLSSLERTVSSYNDIIDVNDVSGDGIKDLVYTKTTREHTCLNNDLEVVWEAPTNAYTERYKRAFYGGMEYLVLTSGGQDAWLTMNTATGEGGATSPVNAWFNDCSPISELNGDRHFDILCGTDDQAFALSGIDGSVIWNMDVDMPVIQACPICDIDGNNSPEMLFSNMIGEITCRSGGTNASAPWGTLTVNVSDNSGFSVEIAEYHLIGEESFSGTVPEDGVLVFPAIAHGTYTLEVSLMLHHDYVLENFEFSSNMVIDVLLEEVLYPVHDFYATSYNNDVTLFWGSMPTRNGKDKKEAKTERYFQGVRLYWEDEMIADMVEGHEYEVGYVPPGTHHFSAVNVYTSGVSEPVTIEVLSVGTEDPGVAPYETALLGNTPNPFNPTTTVRFSLRENLPVTLNVYNLKGQLVRALIDGRMEKGEHSVQWDGDDDYGKPVSSGVYLYQMKAGSANETKKMLLLK